MNTKAVVLTAVGDVVVEDCKLSNREPGDRDGVGSVAKFQLYLATSVSPPLIHQLWHQTASPQATLQKCDKMALAQQR